MPHDADLRSRLGTGPGGPNIEEGLQWAATRYRGVAGLPQCAGVPIQNTFEEIDRCMEMGFVGIMINPIRTRVAGRLHQVWGTNTGTRCTRRWSRWTFPR